MADQPRAWLLARLRSCLSRIRNDVRSCLLACTPRKKPGKPLLFRPDMPRPCVNIIQVVSKSLIARSASPSTRSSLFQPPSCAMKVYTRTGDKGQTSLFNGARVSKDDVRVAAYGTVDECNSALGLACSHLRPLSVLQDPEPAEGAICRQGAATLFARLETVQHRLFDLGAHLATPPTTSSSTRLQRTVFPEAAVTELEHWIDDMEAQLPKLTTFVLPGGHPSAAALHLARTIARRAERTVTPLLAGEDTECEMDPVAYRFLNRLSDFLFVSSRYANWSAGKTDILWSKQAPAGDVL